jgi:hypothetical protein
MGSSHSPLVEYARFATEYNALLYVDDAHGFGIIGEKSDAFLPYYRDEQAESQISDQLHRPGRLHSVEHLAHHLFEVWTQALKDAWPEGVVDQLPESGMLRGVAQDHPVLDDLP